MQCTCFKENKFVSLDFERGDFYAVNLLTTKRMGLLFHFSFVLLLAQVSICVPENEFAAVPATNISETSANVVDLNVTQQESGPLYRYFSFQESKENNNPLPRWFHQVILSIFNPSGSSRNSSGETFRDRCANETGANATEACTSILDKIKVTVEKIKETVKTGIQKVGKFFKDIFKEPEADGPPPPPGAPRTQPPKKDFFGGIKDLFSPKTTSNPGT